MNNCFLSRQTVFIVYLNLAILYLIDIVLKQYDIFSIKKYFEDIDSYFLEKEYLYKIYL